MPTAYQRCVARKLKGRRYRTKKSQQKAFASAVRGCRKFRAKGKKAKRRIKHRTGSLTGYNKCVTKCQRRYGHARKSFEW